MELLATRLGCQKTAAKSLVISHGEREQESPHLNPLPQAGEETNERSNCQYLNRYASLTLNPLVQHLVNQAIFDRFGRIEKFVALAVTGNFLNAAAGVLRHQDVQALAQA